MIYNGLFLKTTDANTIIFLGVISDNKMSRKVYFKYVLEDLELFYCMRFCIMDGY